MDPDQKALAITERQYGVISRGQALDCGLSTSAIHSRVQRGLWNSVHRTVYRVAGVPFTSEARAMAATLAAGSGALVSHLTAGTLWRLIDAPVDEVHITIASRNGLRIPKVKIHRPKELHDW